MNQDNIDLIHQKVQITLTTDCGCYQLILPENNTFMVNLLDDYYENDIKSTSTTFLSLLDALLDFFGHKDKDTISFYLYKLGAICILHNSQTVLTKLLTR